MVEKHTSLTRMVNSDETIVLVVSRQFCESTLVLRVGSLLSSFCTEEEIKPNGLLDGFPRSTTTIHL